MQLSFHFDTDPAPILPAVRDQLARLQRGRFRRGGGLDPISQLVKSSISSRTRDEVSQLAFERLRARFPSWDHLADARAAEVEATIARVTFADDMARHLVTALRRLRAEQGGLDLDFLKDMPVEWAMNRLQALPNVGDKVAAAVLNFSTLRRRVMVVDTHVWRAARRIGLAPANADPRAVRLAIMEQAPPSWTADDFFELHCLLKGLGQQLCMHDHMDCGHCPLAGFCAQRPL